MDDMSARLSIVSAERVQGELSKLLLGREPVRGLMLLVDTGLADIALPELPAMRLAIDAVHRHKDVYLHSLAVLENAIAREDAGPDLTLRMAALLHDIGKPATREIGPDGVSFHHHEVVGAKLARKRLRALKYPKQFVEDVCRLIELHLRFHTYRMGWTDAAVRRYVTDADDLLPRLNKLVRSDCTTRNQRKAADLAAAYDSLEARVVELAKAEELKAIRPDLDGKEIMALLGIPPGPLVGEAYRYLLDQRMERGPIPHEEAVTLLRDWASSHL
jgi:poly(A) polymerase